MTRAMRRRMAREMGPDNSANHCTPDGQWYYLETDETGKLVCCEEQTPEEAARALQVGRMARPSERRQS